MTQKQTVSSAISQLKELLERGCKVQEVQPPVFASDAEVNLVVVTVVCPGGETHTIKAYRDEASELREYIRRMTLQM
jgi:hypothetical protein